MRRIVIAIASTISALVLLFSWPTSTNRPLTTTAAPTATGTTSSGTGSSTPGSSDTASPQATSSGADASGTAPAETPTTAAAPAPTTATFDGDAVSTRYGAVQVRITVTDGVVTAAETVQHPSGGRNEQINSYATPILEQETVAAQSAQIDMVSGATVTSNGYVASLQSALDKAGL